MLKKILSISQGKWDTGRRNKLYKCKYRQTLLSGKYQKELFTGNLFKTGKRYFKQNNREKETRFLY
jgi:hypothetical protein